jgi:hypothetical protein
MAVDVEELKEFRIALAGLVAPHGIVCFTSARRRPQLSQAGLPAESTLPTRREETSGAPTHEHAQSTGASISTSFK